jgi:hypothetical protein
MERDIKSFSKRSIRDIKRDGSHLHVRKSASEPPQHIAETRSSMRRRRNSIGIWFIVILVLSIAFFGISLLFAGANVTITPRTETFPVNETFEASLDASPDQLRYEIMRIHKEYATTVEASGSEMVREQASGEITIFNEFDENEQRLIANTRFQTPEGLIFRIRESIEVPGQRVVNGNTIPGSITVRVYADEPGANYNIGATRFTIPGLQGDPRFDSMYARSESPMTGGFEGERRSVSNSDRERALLNAQSQLESSLLEEVRGQMPEGFILVQDAIVVETEELSNRDSATSDRVEIGKRATASALIISEKELANVIASTFIQDFQGEEVTLDSRDSIRVSVVEEFDPRSSLPIELNVEGIATIMWVINPITLQQELTGLKKDHTDVLFSRNSGIINAQVDVRPFWKQTLPKESKDIEIHITRAYQN